MLISSVFHLIQSSSFYRQIIPEWSQTKLSARKANDINMISSWLHILLLCLHKIVINYFFVVFFSLFVVVFALSLHLYISIYLSLSLSSVNHHQNSTLTFVAMNYCMKLFFFIDSLYIFSTWMSWTLYWKAAIIAKFSPFFLWWMEEQIFGGELSRLMEMRLSESIKWTKAIEHKIRAKK